MQNNKKGEEIPICGLNYEFLCLFFPNSGHMKSYKSLSGCGCERLTNNDFFFSQKRALFAGTACSKWLN